MKYVAKDDGLYHGKLPLSTRIGNWFKSVPTAFKRFGSSIAAFFKSIPSRFVKIKTNIVDAPRPAHASMCLMGLGQVMQKQIIKGCCFFAIFIAYVTYMALAGGRAFYDFFSLGVVQTDPWLGIDGDNSVIMLLMGLLAWILTGFFIAIHIANIKDARGTYEYIKRGNPPPSFKQSIASMLDGKFYITALVLPVLGVFVFNIVPIVFMILIAFTDYGGKIASQNLLISWTGFDSFARLFSLGGIGDTFGKILLWNILWAVMATFLNYFGGLALALLFNKKIVKAKKFWRAFPILAYAIPGFITLLAFKFMFANQGPINYYIQEAGKSSILFLGKDSTWSSRFIGLFVNAWLSVPTSMLLATGVLSNMNTDLFEAAKIDGASQWKQFASITLPFVIFATTPVLIGQFMGNFNNFGVFYFLRGGIYSDGYYLASDTDLLINWLYNISIDNNYYSLGAAISIIIFIISAIISLTVYVRSSSYKKEDMYR